MFLIPSAGELVCLQVTATEKVEPFVSGGRSVHRSVPLRGGCWMLDTWMSALMLAMESNNVVGLRLLKLAGGGSDAYAEASLMVREKMAAAFEAQEAIWSGGTTNSVIDRYREHVAANVKRLTL